MDILLDCASRCLNIPPEPDIQGWSEAAYLSDGAVQLSIRIVDEAESRTLNYQYRNKNKATNVLSFPINAPLKDQVELLGDLVVCAPVVECEAVEQGKSVQAHWAHMLVHGILHLQGYDHEQPNDAEKMEQLEIEILQRLGFANPYA